MNQNIASEQALQKTIQYVYIKFQNLQWAYKKITKDIVWGKEEWKDKD